MNNYDTAYTEKFAHIVAGNYLGQMFDPEIISNEMQCMMRGEFPWQPDAETRELEEAKRATQTILDIFEGKTDYAITWDSYRHVRNYFEMYELDDHMLPAITDELETTLCDATELAISGTAFEIIWNRIGEWSSIETNVKALPLRELQCEEEAQRVMTRITDNDPQHYPGEGHSSLASALASEGYKKPLNSEWFRNWNTYFNEEFVAPQKP